MVRAAPVLRIEEFATPSSRQEPPMTEMAISPLRRRMIEDMTVRNFVEKTQNDYPPRQEPRRLPRPVARYSHGRGSAPLPAAPDRRRHPAAHHQRCGFGAAVLLLRHAGPARRDQTADVRRRAPQDPRRLEPWPVNLWWAQLPLHFLC